METRSVGLVKVWVSKMGRFNVAIVKSRFFFFFLRSFYLVLEKKLRLKLHKFANTKRNNL